MKLTHKYEIKDYIMTSIGEIAVVESKKKQTGYPVSYYIRNTCGNGRVVSEDQVLFKLNSKGQEEEYCFSSKFDLGDKITADSGMGGVISIIDCNSYNEIHYYVKAHNHSEWVPESSVV